MSYKIEKALPQDFAELQTLFFEVYGSRYPLSFAYDKEKMIENLKSDNCYWLLARDIESGRVVATANVLADFGCQIGKLNGVVTAKESRGQGIAKLLVAKTCQLAFESHAQLSSIYTTTRTLGLGPQKMCLANGFIPLGIFPNAHHLDTFESLTLMAKYRTGVLGSRKPLGDLPSRLQGIVAAMQQQKGLQNSGLLNFVDSEPSEQVDNQEAAKFEVIYAPKFVQRRFEEAIKEPYDNFYPFHTPNTLVSSSDGEVELYAYFNRGDRYCAIIASTVAIYKLVGRLGHIIDQVSDMGASYFELLIASDRPASLNAALNLNFLPSAVYPAMRKVEDQYIDFFIMSRTMHPLDFRGMSIDSRFKPYVDQYVENWIQMHLDVLEIFNTDPT